MLCNASNKTDLRTIAVIAILQNAVYLDANTLQQMLSDWFEWMDFEKWSARWNTNNDANVDELILRHHHWMEANNIAFTPTLFINGRKLPGRYGLNDFETLLPQLAEIMLEENVK